MTKIKAIAGLAALILIVLFLFGCNDIEYTRNVKSSYPAEPAINEKDQTAGIDREIRKEKAVPEGIDNLQEMESALEKETGSNYKVTFPLEHYSPQVTLTIFRRGSRIRVDTMEKGSNLLTSMYFDDSKKDIIFKCTRRIDSDSSKPENQPESEVGQALAEALADNPRVSPSCSPTKKEKEGAYYNTMLSLMNSRKEEPLPFLKKDIEKGKADGVIAEKYAVKVTQSSGRNVVGVDTVCFEIARKDTVDGIVLGASKICLDPRTGVVLYSERKAFQNIQKTEATQYLAGNIPEKELNPETYFTIR